MGATWAGVHLRGVSRADLEAAVLRWAAEEGLTRLSDGEPEDEHSSRRILLLEGDGWIALCDEDAELDEGVLLGHGERLSRELRTCAVSLQCVHSDTAALTCHRGGEELGQVRVPEEVERDGDGHAFVDGSFLAPIAPDVAERDWRVRGDFTFPEDTIIRLARLARIPDPQAGARYLWADPDATATRLVFRGERAGEPAAPEETGPTVLSLHANSPYSARTGIPLADHGVFQVSVESGAPKRGADVTLHGPGLRLLDVHALEAWNGHTVDAEGRQILWRCDPIRDGEGLRFRFPEALLRKAPQPMLRGTGAAAMRRFSQALQEGSRGQLMMRIAGEGAAAGEGDLVIAIDAEGARARAQVKVECFDLPPRPVLPPPPAGHDPAEMHSRWVHALEAYAGDAFCVGWLAFDAPLAKMEDAIARLADGAIAQLLSVSGKKNAHARILSLGAHPECRTRWNAKKRLRSPEWRSMWEHLRREAVVTFQAGAQYSHGIVVSIAHQPNGNTIFAEEARAHFAETRPQPPLPPIMLWWTFPKPEPADASESLAAWADGVVREAASMETCIGALVTASGSAEDPSRALPYEEMAGLYRSADSRDWCAAHARAPGWRVLVPRAAASGLPPPDAHSRQERVAAGVLVSSHADDPFAYARDAAAREAMERLLLPCIGTADEQLERE